MVVRKLDVYSICSAVADAFGSEAAARLAMMACSGLLVFVLPASAQGVFDLGKYRDGATVYDVQANAISADGRVVVGEGSNGHAVALRWEMGQGYRALGFLNNGGNAFARAVNRDGSVVVGQSEQEYSRGRFGFRAFRWSAATGRMTALGTLGGAESDARGVSADGAIVVGTSGLPSGLNRAFRWSSAGGAMLSLGVLNGGRESFGYGVSADGNTVVGYANDGAGRGFYRAFRWTAAQGMRSLGRLNNGDDSYATAVNADGSVVVGYAADGAARGRYTAFRWAATSPTSGSLQSLGVLSRSGTGSEAHAVSADGAVVVGLAYQPSLPGGQAGFRWMQAGGMVTGRGGADPRTGAWAP